MSVLLDKLDDALAAGLRLPLADAEDDKLGWVNYCQAGFSNNFI